MHSDIVPVGADRTQCASTTFWMPPCCEPQTVGFGDKLFFRKLPEGAVADGFDCNMKGVPTDGSNLVLRALDLFRERTSSKCCYEVRSGGDFAIILEARGLRRGCHVEKGSP